MSGKKTRWSLVAGLVGALTLALAGPASAKDRNNDRIPDRWEKRNGLSLKKKQTRRDQDRDGLKNIHEFRAKTDPRDADTDDDGVPDGEEGSGKIASYDPETGELVINLFGGSSVSGLVTERTKIRCGCRGRHGGRGNGPREPSDPEGSEDGETLHHPGGPRPEGDRGNTEGGPAPEGRRPGKGKRRGRGRRCSTDELVEGAIVHQARLVTTADGLVFAGIRLVKADPDESGEEGSS